MFSRRDTDFNIFLYSRSNGSNQISIERSKNAGSLTLGIASRNTASFLVLRDKRGTPERGYDFINLEKEAYFSAEVIVPLQNSESGFKYFKCFHRYSTLYIEV
jgi:hypothetical protein